MRFIGTTLGRVEHEQDGFVVEGLAEALRLEWVNEALKWSGRKSVRRRLLPAEFVVWFVVLLGLYRRTSYGNLLEKLAGTWWSWRRWPQDKPPSTSAVTKARDRLGVEPVKILYERSADGWVKATEGLRLVGKRVCAFDGTTCKTPDTPENRSHWGKPGASRGAAAYPQLRMVALLDVGTRLVKAFRHGPYRRGEIGLARDLLPAVRDDNIVLLDRDFAAYDFLWDLHTDRGADFVVRIRKNMKVLPVRRLSVGDAIVEVRVPRHFRRKRPDMPRTWLLREITYRPEGAGEEIRLLTTLIDADDVSKDELAQLYGRRWDEETSIDEVKTHLCKCATITEPVIFRSRTPSRVEQELYGLVIAYNVVRFLAYKAARTARVSPLRLSFTAAVERIREAMHDMMRMPTRQLPQRYRRMLDAIARAKAPERPGRRYPRAVKIKMSRYPLKRSNNAA